MSRCTCNETSEWMQWDARKTAHDDEHSKLMLNDFYNTEYFKASTLNGPRGIETRTGEVTRSTPHNIPQEISKPKSEQTVVRLPNPGPAPQFTPWLPNIGKSSYRKRTTKGVLVGIQPAPQVKRAQNNTAWNPDNTIPGRCFFDHCKPLHARNITNENTREQNLSG